MGDVGPWVGIIAAGGGGSVITFITFWMALSARISAAEAAAKSAEARGANADTLASAAIAKCELMIREINDARVQHASKIAALEAVSDSTAKSLMQAETRLAKSIDDLGEKMDHLGDTIIKTLGELAGRQQDHRRPANG